MWTSRRDLVEAARSKFVKLRNRQRRLGRLRSTARNVVALALRLRPLASIFVGAILASWLLPIAVLRYQRLESARTEAMTQLTGLTVHVNTAQVSSRQFAEVLDSHWEFILASQFRELELEEQRGRVSGREITREEHRLAAAIADARESYRAARDDFYRQAVGFETWSLETAGTLSRLYPSHRHQIHAAFNAAAERIRTSAENARRRELGYRVIVHVRAGLIRQQRHDLKNRKINATAYKRNLVDLKKVSVKSGTIMVRVPQLLKVAEELYLETPSAY